MPADGEEGIVGTHVVAAEHLAPDLEQLRRDAMRRAGLRANRTGPREPAHPFAIDLSARHPRHVLDQDDPRRDHERRQNLPERARQPFGRRGAGDGCYELVAVDGDGCLCDTRTRAQRRLHFRELDPVPADLDLVVEPTEHLDRAVRQPPRAVAGAVQPPAGRPERIGHEPVRGRRRIAEVAARDGDAADGELADDADRQGREPLVDDVELRVRDRRPDRYPRPLEVAGLDAAEGDADARLRRTVLVEHVDVRQARQQSRRKVRGELLAAAEDAAERSALREPGLGDDVLQQRRHEVDARQLPPPHEFEQVRGVGVQRRRGELEQRSRRERREDLVQRDVERDRRLVEDALPRAEAVALTAAGDPVCEARVR